MVGAAAALRVLGQVGPFVLKAGQRRGRHGRQGADAERPLLHLKQGIRMCWRYDYTHTRPQTLLETLRGSQDSLSCLVQNMISVLSIGWGDRYFAIALNTRKTVRVSYWASVGDHKILLDI